MLIGVLDAIMMYGAYSTTRRLAVARIFLRFIWFGLASVFICFLYVYVNILSLHLFSFQWAFAIFLFFSGVAFAFPCLIVFLFTGNHFKHQILIQSYSSFM